MKTCLFWSHFWLFWKQQILFITYGHDESNVAVVVQSLSCVWLFATLWTTASQASLSFTISWSLFKFMSIESLMLYNHLILCHFIHLLPSVFPSIRVFPNKLVLRIRWPKYWSFSFSINPSNEYTDFRTAVYSGERGERIEREGTFIVLFLFIKRRYQGK